jgi:hypothetical protein
LVQSTWKATCRNCHDWVHSHPSEARILGWLKWFIYWFKNYDYEHDWKRT